MYSQFSDVRFSSVALAIEVETRISDLFNWGCLMSLRSPEWLCLIQLANSAKEPWG